MPGERTGNLKLSKKWKGEQNTSRLSLKRLPACSARWTSGSAGKPFDVQELVSWKAEPVQARCGNIPAG